MEIMEGAEGGSKKDEKGDFFYLIFRGRVTWMGRNK